MTLRATLLRLRDEELLTHPEIAERLDMTLNSVGNHMVKLPPMSDELLAAKSRRLSHARMAANWRKRGYDPTPPPRDELIGLRESGMTVGEVAAHYKVPEELVKRWIYQLPNLSKKARLIIRQNRANKLRGRCLSGGSREGCAKTLLTEDTIAALYRGRRYGNIRVKPARRYRGARAVPGPRSSMADVVEMA